MDGQARRWTPERVVVIAAIAFGVAAGTNGIANAASGSGQAPAPSAQRPWARSGATRPR
jgi:hypothetical protein